MFVTVRLFARLRELAGAGELALQLPNDATARDAWYALAAQHRVLEPYEASISCAINADYSAMTARLNDGDEIAFLPPVSGG